MRSGFIWRGLRKLMSNEELERIMNFIIEREEYAATQIVRLNEAQAKLAEAQTRLAQKQAGLVEAQTGLAQTQSGQAEQLDDYDERIARFERSYVVIAQLLEKHDTQLDSVTEGLNNVTDGLANVTSRLANVTDEIGKLARLVDRYIAARGNGSNGGA
jgi:DNA anti-recombination protein RmuC